MAKKVTKQNFKKVLLNFLAWYEDQDDAGQKITAKDFNDFLDDLSADDAFGTEGQCDPRGDQRD